METYTLTRTGDAPLKFRGELLAEASSHQRQTPRENRWHELRLYKPADDVVGRLVIQIEYHTRWQGEQDCSDVYTCRPESVAACLREHDPTGPVKGYPDHESYRERQERLLAEITIGYEQAVSDLLAVAGITATLDAERQDDGLYREAHLRRYRQLLRRELADLELSKAEACLICDSLNGCDLGSLLTDDEDDATEWLWWPANLEDSIRLNRLDQKWEVDGAALLARVKTWPRSTLLAVFDAASRFWRDHVDEPTDKGLRAVGLLEDDEC